MAEQTPDPIPDLTSASNPPASPAGQAPHGITQEHGGESSRRDGSSGAELEPKAVRVEYRIRRAKFDDQDRLLDLLEPFVAQKKLLKRTRAEILLLMATGYVAEIDSSGNPSGNSSGDSPSDEPQIIGFSAVEIYSRKLGEIQCLAVADGYHGNGIGGALVEACVELAREKGILEVMAISSSDAFLKKLGFDYSLPEQKRALFRQLHSRDEIFNSDE